MQTLTLLSNSTSALISSDTRVKKKQHALSLDDVRNRPLIQPPGLQRMSSMDPLDQPMDRTLSQTLHLQEYFNLQAYLRGKQLPLSLLQRYHITGLLGQGGYGIVLSAYSFSHQKQVAIKLIEQARIPKHRRHVLSGIPFEVDILSNLNHEHIVGYYEHFHDDDFVYLVMALYGHEETDSTCTHHLKPSTSCPSPLLSLPRIPIQPCTDLFTRLQYSTTLPESQAKFIFHQLAQAVCYLHERGIVHRDIKDENIVLNSHDHVTLIDFGSAASSRTKFTDYTCSMPFASPEILSRKRYFGPPADIWALGVVLYLMVYGDIPFASSTETRKAPLAKPYLPHPPSLPCQHLIEWMLSKSPEQRPTAHQLLDHEWLKCK